MPSSVLVLVDGVLRKNFVVDASRWLQATLFAEENAGVCNSLQSESGSQVGARRVVVRRNDQKKLKNKHDVTRKRKKCAASMS